MNFRRSVLTNNPVRLFSSFVSVVQIATTTVSTWFALSLLRAARVHVERCPTFHVPVVIHGDRCDGIYSWHFVKYAPDMFCIQMDALIIHGTRFNYRLCKQYFSLDYNVRSPPQWRFLLNAKSNSFSAHLVKLSYLIWDLSPRLLSCN